MKINRKRLKNVEKKSRKKLKDIADQESSEDLIKYKKKLMAMGLKFENMENCEMEEAEYMN